MAFVIMALVLFGLGIFIVLSLPGTPAAKLGLIKHLQTFSPLLIGLVWLAYGTLHLASPESAVRQMPEWLDPWRHALFAASGALEIGLGLLAISVEWREKALLAQMILLAALTPFVVYLLIDYRAIIDLMGTTMPVGLARLVVVFHNILLFLWIQWTYRDTLKQRGVLKAPPPASSKYSPVLIVALVMLAANIAGFAAICASPWYHALPDVWAMACLASGALIGFVFGVPRWVRPKDEGAKRERYEPNANIEKLSDWLTKIVVGVGLVELHQIGPTLSRMSDVFAMGAVLGPGRIGSAEEAHAFASAVIVYFFAAGIIQGFLLTRMFLTRAWQAHQGA